MSLEKALIQLAESNVLLAEATTKNAEASDRNTDAGLRLLAARTDATELRIEGLTGSELINETTARAAADTLAEKAPAKKKRKDGAKKTKPKAEAEAEVEVEAEKEPEATEDDETPLLKTMVDVRAAAVAMKDALGRDSLLKAREVFKIKKVADLEERDYPRFIRHCEDQMAAADDEV